MGKGEALNRRVWRLFEQVGFKTQPNSQVDEERLVKISGKLIPIDLYAHDPELNVTIVTSNKSGKRANWSAHVTYYKRLGQAAKANAVLFVVTGTELDATERDHLAQEGVFVWTVEDLAYYEAVADAIGTYAKFEIINALRLHTEEEKATHRVLALRLRQPTNKSQTEAYLFTACPELLLKTCHIYRRANGNAQAYQRMLRKNRLPKIRAFVSKIDSILPTNIIVHLSDRVTVDVVRADGFRDASNNPIVLTRSRDGEVVVLNIPKEFASMELIDGQHRLYGFVDTGPDTRNNFNLVVLGVRDLSAEKRRDTFVAINDNSRRMDANLVAYLKYTEDDSACQADPELMAIRIAVDLNSATPFKKAIKLTDVVGRQKITLKGLSGYDLKGLIGPKGLLRKYYSANSPAEYVRVLRLYFSSIRTAFKREWSDNDKYIVATNRGISAFLKLLKSILRSDKGALDPISLRNYLQALKDSSLVWEFEHLKKTYVGSQGWKDFHRELVAAIRKKFPSFKE